MCGAWHEADMRDVHKILVRKSEWKTQLVRHKRRKERIQFREIRRKDGDWIVLRRREFSDGLL